ncbi:hypothetical protein FOVG_19360 [Fusarium oxysporum f. sp. pisi HDV247]|uniref:Uncharacterized protein n=1 Tax=Fusarium oxysporum f. sp. pisi HDV247 TaxID=1080344 RepID=W9NMK2_FUSOX|nr:hypothetical protein FOVG_19360 [Fusarium oxysporum f. sp. pisi HDV247]
MPAQLTCEECGSSFQRRESYQRHLRTHTKEKPFACSVCGRTFGRVDSLARHYSATHAGALQIPRGGPGERQRVSRACKRCSTAKVRCDGQTPCQKCCAADAHCFYEPPKRRSTAQQRAFAKVHSQLPESDVQHETNMPQLITPEASGEPMLMDGADLQRSSGDELLEREPLQYDMLGTYGDISFVNDLSLPDWVVGSLDMNLLPASFGTQHQQEAQLLQSTISPSLPLTQFMAEDGDTPRVHLPQTPASDIADFYNRIHEPALDKDAVEIRQYHPTSIEIDAPLSGPEVDLLSLPEADLEDFAHVDGLSTELVESMVHLVEEMQTKPHYPPFNTFTIPPRPVLNAWVQLYFEYFHPVFPVLSKTTFSTPAMHPLLVLVVAAIGAQFSDLKNAMACARALRELVRRQASRLCENQNKYGRTVWMTQIVMLNSLAMSHSGERRELEVAEILQSVPAALARRMSLFDDIVTHEKILQLHAPLEQTWRLWAMDEERRRAGFGVWLVDSAYRSHFNLTRVVNPHELKNSLPQQEQRWSAINAQSWASFPPGLGCGRTETLANVISQDKWLSTWSKTGTIGKQVIIQELTDMVRPADAQRHRQNAFPDPEREHARDILEKLLSLMESHEKETSVAGLKALVAHKIMCLAALMLSYSPIADLTAAALRRIYKCLDDQELFQIKRAWNASPYQGRKAVLYAARLLESVRSNHTTHYSTPVFLLRAVLTLWLHSILSEKSESDESSIGKDDASSSVVIGTTNSNIAQINGWLSSGRGRVRIPGMANLLCLQGRRKLLEEAVVAMQSLKSWGASRSYLELLKRLERSEVG